MRAVLYARVSSDAQDVSLSIGAQLRALREYAEKQGYSVVREFVDHAMSGRTAARPAFREMIALAKTKEPPFNAILVWKLNRFSRKRLDSITYKELLRQRGINVISINEPLEDNPSGKLLYWRASSRAWMSSIALIWDRISNVVSGKAPAGDSSSAIALLMLIIKLK